VPTHLLGIDVESLTSDDLAVERRIGPIHHACPRTAGTQPLQELGRVSDVEPRLGAMLR
jgi:hypothetical protein